MVTYFTQSLSSTWVTQFFEYDSSSFIKSRLQDEESATIESNLVEKLFESDVDKSLVKSFLRMSFSEDLIMKIFRAIQILGNDVGA